MRYERPLDTLQLFGYKPTSLRMAKQLLSNLALKMKMSNIKLGKSGALRVTTAAAARALMAQDLAAGLLESPDVTTNRDSPLMDMPRHNPTTMAAIKAAKFGKVTDVSVDDL